MSVQRPLSTIGPDVDGSDRSGYARPEQSGLGASTSFDMAGGHACSRCGRPRLSQRRNRSVFQQAGDDVIGLDEGYRDAAISDLPVGPPTRISDQDSHAQPLANVLGERR
jgi:hypothetical protein